MPAPLAFHLEQKRNNSRQRDLGRRGGRSSSQTGTRLFFTRHRTTVSGLCNCLCPRRISSNCVASRGFQLLIVSGILLTAARYDLLCRHLSSRWAKITEVMPGRTAKQCRERYNNHVDPAIKKDKIWTAEEDALVMQLHAEHHNQFAKIARLIPGRCYDDVKNRQVFVRWWT